MNRGTAAVLLVVLAALVAGCGGTSQEQDETLTPVPSVEPEGGGLPPGVTTAGLVDESRLWAADADALEDGDYVAELWINGSRVGDSGRRGIPPAPGSVHRVARIEAGGRPLLVVAERRDGDTVERRNRWVDADGKIEQSAASADAPVPVTTSRSGEVQPRANRAVGPLLRDLVAVGDYRTVTRVQTDEGNWTRLVARDATAARPPNAPRNITAYEGEILVDEAGRVQSAQIRLRVSDGGEFEYRVDYRLRQVGNVSVERPAWAEDAETD